MQTTSQLVHFPTLPPRLFSKNFECRKTLAHQQKRPSSCIIALKRDNHEHGKDHGYNGRLVDDNMIVLRMRIRERKMMEMKDANEAPSDWMEWEKRWYLSYDSDVCEVVGFLQTMLMETRPSLVLGMVALLMIGVPTSMAFVLHYLMDIFR